MERVQIEFVNQMSQKETFTFYINIKLERPIKTYCKKVGISTDSVYFLRNGNIIRKEDYKRPISYFLSSLDRNEGSREIISQDTGHDEISYYMNIMVIENENHCSFWIFLRKNKKIIIIGTVAIVIIVIFMIILFKVILKKKVQLSLI